MDVLKVPLAVRSSLEPTPDLSRALIRLPEMDFSVIRFGASCDIHRLASLRVGDEDASDQVPLL